MKSLVLYVGCIVAVFFLFRDVSAQQIKNVHADFDGEKVIISYDLFSEHPDDRFTVSIYSSHDNYQAPLSLLVGDAGENILPTNSHRVTWDAKSSLSPDFNAEIIFKVKAIIVVGLHQATRFEVKPLDFATFKRGGILNLEWNGGKEGEPVSIELLKKNELVEKISEVQNNNMFSWSIPKKSKPGKDYSIRISKVASSDINAISQPFEIKPKISLLVKLIPVAVVGGVVVILSSSKEEEPDLPGPIPPGG